MTNTAWWDDPLYDMREEARTAAAFAERPDPEMTRAEADRDEELLNEGDQ
jgi:hypothetical protein